MYSETRFVEQAKQLNVDGYLLKHATKTELVECIEKVLSVSNSSTLNSKNCNRNLHHEDYFVRTFSLTPREVEIIGLIKQGLSSPQIAEKLFITEETVKSHRKNIYYKLSISNIAELLAFANANGL